MSTHTLDVSGARPLTTRTNDPASTYASTPAKQGDDVSATLSGFRELRVELPETARIQRRRYVRNDVVYENGKAKKDDGGGYVTEAVEYDRLIVVTTGVSMFGRTSIPASLRGQEGTPTHESHPHTQVVAKRWGDEQHFLESGVLVEEYEVADLYAPPEE